MIDSLAIAIALLASPNQRPSLERVSHISAPSEKVLVLARKDEKPAEKLATCFQNEYGTCWNSR